MRNNKMKIAIDKFQIDVSNISENEDFRCLINWLFEKSSTFGLIERAHSELGELGNKFLERINPFVISKKKVNRWPGTETYPENGYGGVLYCFKCNEITKKIFLKYIQSFEQFRMPEMLEDPCFFSSNGEVVFYSVIHEEIKCIVNLDKTSVEMIREKFNLPTSSISGFSEQNKRYSMC